MGDGRNPFDDVYVGNLAHGQVLPAKALPVAFSVSQVPRSGCIDGEAFHIIDDDEHWFFWKLKGGGGWSGGLLGRRRLWLLQRMWGFSRVLRRSGLLDHTYGKEKVEYKSQCRITEH